MINPGLSPQVAAMIAQRMGQNMRQPQTQNMGQPTAAPMEKPRPYAGTIPELAAARSADPNQQVTNGLLGAASNTDPTAQNGWAWADGLSRVLSGAAGGYFNSQDDKKYAGREAGVVNDTNAAINVAQTPQQSQAPLPPAPVTPPQQHQIAQALGDPNLQGNGGGIAPMQPGQSFAEAFAPFGGNPPGGPPQPPPMQAPAPSPYMPSRTPLSGPSASPTASPVRSRRATPANQGTPPVANASELFTKGILDGGERSRRNRAGGYDTSFKGAIGPAQVMPGTAPSAAKMAGIPWDEKLYRSQTEAGYEYNLKLGQAYFNEQLRTFGDPAKAAAAYNAGPGAVTRAQRRATRNGGEWVDYLPSTTKDGKVVDTTKKYVERFLSSVGSTGSESNTQYSSRTTVDPIEAVGATAAAAPEYENVQEMGQADYVPPEVETNRINMAKQMLASGNPDMVVMARAYLDKGLDEQNAARTARNAQQFTQGSDERSNAFVDRRQSQARNFGREETANTQTFTANESAADREQQTRLAQSGQAFTSNENAVERDFRSKEAATNRAFEAEQRKAEFENRNKGNPFFDTVGGRKLADEMYATIDNNALAISKYDRLLQILDNGLDTGTLYSGYTGEQLQENFGGLNSDVGEFLALQNDTTLAKIGGSLGVAISDGDRKFIANSNVNLGKDQTANRNVALATIGALQRKTDYTYARMNAEMGGPEALKAFTNSWRAFAETNAIVKYDKKGNVSEVSRNPIKYEDWLASRPNFDTNGNRMK